MARHADSTAFVVFNRRAIKNLLLEQERTQRQLARAVDVSEVALSNWLCGARACPRDVAQRIAAALGGVDLAAIIVEV